VLTTPPEIENKIAGGYLASGFEFQFRIEGTGHFRIRKFVPQARTDTDKSEGEQQGDVQCVQFNSCDLDWFAYSSIPT
jgi:hypothetical protein